MRALTRFERRHTVYPVSWLSVEGKDTTVSKSKKVKSASPVKSKPREVVIPHHAYQPSHAELRSDLRIEGTFEEAIKALVRPVRVRKVMPRKR